MSVRAKYALVVVLLAATAVVWAICLPRTLSMWRGKKVAAPVNPASYVPLGGTSSGRLDAESLRGTIVTPHLECAITGDKNILWCATFQVAWNELCDLLGSPIKARKVPEMVGVLNRKAVTRADLDEASCVAMAGYPTGGPDDVLDRIAAEMKEKFGEAVKPEFLPGRRELRRDDWLAYGFLLKELPFEWSFKRLPEWSLTFAGHAVEPFGIHQLVRMDEEEVKAASQVIICYDRGPDDFIVELKTRSQTDRLILAKVQPSATLSETIRDVQQRMAIGPPQHMQGGSHLVIPVVDFDVVRGYAELSRIGIAVQQIRFKLDETGAVLKSEAYTKKNGRPGLIFDKPFLVMIQRTDARVPYFALWVANAELLTPRSREGARRQD